MEYIVVNQPFTAVFPIPESQQNDAVTFQIRKVSDGSVITSGSALFLAGTNWKVTFTPAIVGEVYIVEVNDATLDVPYAQIYRCVSTATLSAPISDSAPEISTSSLLYKVKAAIDARLNGGAVQSYTVNGRNIQYMTMQELLALKRNLEQQTTAERGIGRTYAQFSNP